MWLKYSNAQITLDPGMTWEQDSRLLCYGKPNGFWFTDETEENWHWWCVSEGFKLHNLSHKHEITLDESRILFLRSRNAIIAGRRFARGEIEAAALAAARDAAMDTAMDTARDATMDAARVAAMDTAEAWQFDRLIARLSDEEPEDWSLLECKLDI